MSQNISQNPDRDKSPSKKMTSRQMVSLAGVILLVLLYVVTLIVAIVDSSSSGQLFAMCLFATIAVPLLIWIYTWLYGRMTGKHTIGDPKEREEEAPQ